MNFYPVAVAIISFASAGAFRSTSNLAVRLCVNRESFLARELRHESAANIKVVATGYRHRRQLLKLEKQYDRADPKEQENKKEGFSPFCHCDDRESGRRTNDYRSLSQFAFLDQALSAALLGFERSHID